MVKRSSGDRCLESETELPLAEFTGVIQETLSRELGRTETPLPAEAFLLADATDMPPMPVRRLQNFVYCPRLFYYQWVEDIFVENADTVEGSAVHSKADTPTRLQDVENLDLPEGRSIRSLQLENTELGLIGKIDILEGGEDGIEVVATRKDPPGAMKMGCGSRKRRMPFKSQPTLFFSEARVKTRSAAGFITLPTSAGSRCR